MQTPQKEKKTRAPAKRILSTPKKANPRGRPPRAKNKKRDGDGVVIPRGKREFKKPSSPSSPKKTRKPYPRASLHTETTPQRERYEKLIHKVLAPWNTGRVLSVGDIERALQWVTLSSLGISLHPLLIVGFHSTNLSSLVAWLLWVEARCTGCTFIESGESGDGGKEVIGWGEWFCGKYGDAERMTGIGRIPLHSLVKKLRALGVVQTKRVGVPAMQLFRVDHSAIYTIIMEAFLAQSPPIPDALDSSEWTRSVL